MLKLIEDEKEVDVNTNNLPLLEDLFNKWGLKIDTQVVVTDIDKITCELSAWGIPWKRTKWTY